MARFDVIAFGPLISRTVTVVRKFGQPTSFAYKSRMVRRPITNGPATMDAFDSEDASDLLVGYSRDRDAIVVYDRRWLENWTQKKEASGSGGSPSVQVKEADIKAGHDKGIHHISKSANFGLADIVTMSPARLPAFLLNHDAVPRGEMTAAQAEGAAQPTGSTVFDYCRRQGFPFEPDLIARYLASALTKPLVILAGGPSPAILLALRSIQIRRRRERATTQIG